MLDVVEIVHGLHFPFVVVGFCFVMVGSLAGDDTVYIKTTQCCCVVGLASLSQSTRTMKWPHTPLAEMYRRGEGNINTDQLYYRVCFWCMNLERRDRRFAR